MILLLNFFYVFNGEWIQLNPVRDLLQQINLSHVCTLQSALKILSTKATVHAVHRIAKHTYQAQLWNILLTVKLYFQHLGITMESLDYYKLLILNRIFSRSDTEYCNYVGI